MVGMLAAIFLGAVAGAPPASPAEVRTPDARSLAADRLGAIAGEVVSAREIAGGGAVRLMLRPRASEVLPGLCVSRFIDVGERLVAGPPARRPAEPLLDIRTRSAFRLGVEDLDLVQYTDDQEAARTARLQRRCEADTSQAGYFTADSELDAFNAARVLAQLAAKSGFDPGTEVMCNGGTACKAEDLRAAASFRAAELTSVTSDDSCKTSPLDAEVMCLHLRGRTPGIGQARGWGLSVKLIATDKEREVTFNDFRIASVLIARGLRDDSDMPFGLD
jgi:hypothetical protein